MSSNNKFVTRAYNRFSRNYIKGTVTKFSKEVKLKKEIDYFLSLPEELKIFFPRLVSHGLNIETQEYFMELEYYPVPNLYKHGLVKLEAGKTDLTSVLGNILKEFQKYKPQQTSIDDLKKIYIEKTEVEQKKLVDDFEYFNEFSNHDSIKFNGIEYENFHIIWPKIKNIATNLLLDEVIYGIIHGDMCFSNIICMSEHISLGVIDNTIRFIDPRGEFGQHKIYGDIYYDLGKLYHSTNTGYELIIYDEFHNLKSTANEISFEFTPHLSMKKNSLHECFSSDIYNQYNLNKIQLIEGLMYISMCARHYDSLDRQKIMYGNGIKILNEVYNNIK